MTIHKLTVSCPKVTAPEGICYRGVLIHTSAPPYNWCVGNSFWTDAVPNGADWSYQNCYPTPDAAKLAIDNLYAAGWTFNQC